MLGRKMRGCDGELSNICGQCGTHCHLVTGIYLSKNKPGGTDHVTTIPKDSQLVRLSESGGSHIGLRTNSSVAISHDYLDGKSYSTGYDVIGGFKSNQLSIKGPLDGDVDVLAIYNGAPWRYIRYEFYRPLAAVWKHREHAASCSTTCGGGLQFIRPVCVDVKTEEETDAEFCGGLIPPSPLVHRCNDLECPPSSTTFKRIETSFEFVRRNLWVPDPWTSCSAECSGGFQTRIISCAEETLHGVYFTSDAEPCVRIPPPQSWRSCNEDPCPLWFAQPWSTCRRIGGSAFQNRIVQCRTPGGFPAYSCDVTNKPIRMRRCSGVAGRGRVLSQKAPSVISVSTEPGWMPGSWGECSRTCGNGVTVREVFCKKINPSSGTIDDLDDVICVDEKPTTSQVCSMGSCFDYDVTDFDYDVTDDEYSEEVYHETGNAVYHFLESFEFEWKFDNFSSCAPSCGNGTRTSISLCRHKATNTVASPDHCDATVRPESRLEKCFGGTCHVGAVNRNNTRWDLTPYRDCNATCGRGLQMRSVVCRQMPEGEEDYFDSSGRVRGRRMPEVMCPSPKPKDKVACSQVACAPKWVPQLWSKCSRSCGRGVQSRELRCFQKLGTGRTVEVANYFCPKVVPDTRRSCNVRSCSAKYSATQWSECHVTCGKGVQTRSVACMQVLAGKFKPREVPRSKCRRLVRPLAKKTCHLGKCPPLIFTSEDVLVQKKKRAKIQLQVGNRAYILPSTTVIVKCRVERYKKELLRWEYNGSSVTNRRISIMPDGSLRLLHSRATDSGTYTCVADTTRANFHLTVGNNLSASPSFQLLSASDMDHLVATTSDIDMPVDGVEEPISRPSIPPRRLVSMAPRPEPLPRFDPFQISYTEQRPVLVDRDRDYDETKEYITKFDDNSQNGGETSELTHMEGYKDFIEQVNSIKELSKVDFNNASDSDINNLLELLTESSAEPKDRIQTSGNHEREPTFPTGNHDMEPTFVSGIHDREPTYISGNHDREPTFISGIHDREPTFISGIHDREPTFVSGHHEREPTFISGNHDSGPTFISGNHDSGPTFISGNHDRGPTFISGNHDREPTFVSGGHDREPTFVSGNHDREPTFVTGSHSREPTFVTGSHVRDQEASSKRARITPHPTRVPLQLDREVDAYVGGSLIVADADTITILCEATGEPAPTYSWFRDDVMLPENRRQFILRDGSLRLLYPQTTDSGNYMCVASNLHGNDSQVTSLSVAKVPRIMSTTSAVENFTAEHVVATVGSEIRAKLGSKVTIRCPAEGSPDPFVIWYKDGPGLRQNSKLLSDNSIEVFPTTAADQGLFGCEASNPAGTDYQASSLVLIDPPRISEQLNVLPNIEGVVGLPELLMTTIELEHYKVKVNSSVMMGCPVTGFPEPDIKWYFNNELLTDMGNTIDYQLLQNNKVLQLANAYPTTRGHYSCVASNEGGTLNTSLSLDLIVYNYQHGEFTECSASCGDSGTQYRDIVCLEDGAKVVDEWYCIGLQKPFVVIQPCNRIDCPPKFVSGSWGRCSVSCGNGTRNRDMACSILMSDGSIREVAAEECNDVIPSSVETCSEHNCPRWKLGPWQKCTRRCVGRGVGVKTRKVYCVSANGSHVEPRASCRHLPRPKRRSYCSNRRCEPVWMASTWSVCSSSCGSSGIRTRILNCVYRGRRRQSARDQCNAHRRPPVSTPCNRSSCSNDSSTPKPTMSRNRTPCASKSRCVLIRRRKLCRFYRSVCCKICNW